MPSRGLEHWAPTGPNRRRVRPPWGTSKRPWLRMVPRIFSGLRPVSVVINRGQGVAARREGHGLCCPVRMSGGDRRRLGPPPPPSRRAEAGQELGPPAEPVSGREVERVQRGYPSGTICWRHRRLPRALRLDKIECSTPRDSPGFASVPKKRRSRHASQALLFFMGAAVRCVAPFVLLPDCEASAAHNRTTSLTLRIELEDDLEIRPASWGPLPRRWAR
jgi:hypothetical protein